MKRFLALLVVLLTLVSSFSACEEPEEMWHAEVVSQTEQFIIRRVDGICYLDLGYKNTRQGYWDLVPSGVIPFRSADHMYQTLMTGSIAPSSIWDIRCSFPLDASLGFQIVDPQYFYVPMLPAGNEIREVWMGSGHIRYETTCGNFVVTTMKEKYESWMEYLGRFVLQKEDYKNLTKRVQEDREIYEYLSWDGLQYRVTQYSIVTDDKTYYVECEYIEPDDAPEWNRGGEGRCRYRIFGCHNGAYFWLDAGYLEKEPSAQWIKLLGAKVYVPE